MQNAATLNFMKFRRGGRLEILQCKTGRRGTISHPPATRRRIRHRRQRGAIDRVGLYASAYYGDLNVFGAYVRGSVPAIDKAIELREHVLPWLRQAKNERSPLAQTRAAMDRIAATWTF